MMATRAFLFLPPVLFTIAIWLPFGFSVGGLVEEWGILQLFSLVSVVYVIGPDSPLHEQSIRPFTILPHAIAYALDPLSFRYWHVLSVVSLIIKGISAGVIGHYITNSLFIGVVVGLLTIAYPADTMQLSLRMIHLNWAVALALLSVASFLGALHHQSARRRLSLALLAAGIFATGALMYEVVVFLFALPFLAVFARYGMSRTTSILAERWPVSMIWLAVFALCVSYMVWVFGAVRTYQMEIIGQVGLHFLTDSERWTSLIRAFYRSFIEAWFDTLRFAMRELSSFSYPIFITLALAGILYVASTQTKTGSKYLRVAWRTAFVGFLGFVLGYLPFISSIGHTYLTQRTYLASAFGAALVLGALLLVTYSRAGRWVAISIATFMSSVGFVGQLYQFDKYNRIYADIIQPMLSAATRVVYATPKGYTPVLVNDFGYLSGTFDMGAPLEGAVSYVVGRGHGLVVCEGRTNRKLPRAHGALDQRSSCLISDGQVTIQDRGRARHVENPFVWRLAPDGNISTVSQISASNPEIPPKLSNMTALSTWRSEHSLFRNTPSNTYHCKFESMWGFAQPCRTFGFFEGRPFKVGLRTISAAWIGETRAGLIFDLDPDPVEYFIVIRVRDWLGSAREMSLLVNDKRVDHEWKGDAVYATIEPSILKKGINTVEIQSAPDRNHGFSGSIVAVEVNPRPGHATHLRLHRARALGSLHPEHPHSTQTGQQRSAGIPASQLSVK